MKDKTEKQKMLNNELYCHQDLELTRERNMAYSMITHYNRTKDHQYKKRYQLLEKLLGELGKNIVIKPPFVCDYGYNICLGDNVFVNYGCTILDCNKVYIGNNVLIAPQVQIYTAYHPTDYRIRLQNLEYAQPIRIGNNVWIGGAAVICNGVTIGDNTTIGAGSIVVSDIPANCVAVGNPCRVVKKLDTGTQIAGNGPAI